MKRMYFYIGIFVGLVLIMFLIENSIPEPVDWTPTFDETRKKPFGTYIIKSELKTFFPRCTVENANVTPFEKLYYSARYDNASYILINDFQYLDTESIDELLDFARSGNKVFISSSEFSPYLLDTLDVYIDLIDYSLDFADTVHTFGFYNENLKSTYQFGIGFVYTAFKQWEFSTSQALGYMYVDTSEYVNFIRVNFGAGGFYLHTQPYAFTNYHMLKDNHNRYAAEVFAFLDNETILWDCKQEDAYANNRSSLRFILSNRALAFAWRLGVVGLLLFVIFTAKRKQRIVPVITPLTNTSEEFARTIGQLYLREGNPKDIIAKKITYFLEKIRTNYMIDTTVLDDEFKNRLHQKSGVDRRTVDRLIDLIVYLNGANQVDQIYLLKLNELLNKFNSKTF
jgi:hypothetical protein